MSIPTVIDRCIQAMVKNALEPSWEARFEAISYGFRPGRGCHDAIARIFVLANGTSRRRWVVDADIKGAFDNIDHEYLLQAIGAVPGRELIRQWLKAGYMEDGVYHPTETGTPQGGVISPLLANIALHGMEEALGVKYGNQGPIRGKRAVVRYADDFVVFCESKEDGEVSVQILTEWLAKRGLTLSAEKTRVVQLTEGFDFLGFNIKQYKTSNTHTGWKLLIKPSNESVKNIRKKLREQWRKLRGTNVTAVIKAINPIIRGEAHYFRIAVAKKTFRALDTWMFAREVRWVKATHPQKPWRWQKARYWGRLNKERNDNWVFGNKQPGVYLLRFAWFKIERHVLIRGTASPDDPSLQAYWVDRTKRKSVELTPIEERLARKQNYVCPLCGQSLFNEEELHIHHVQPQGKGGPNTDENRRLVHLYCHQQIHSGKGVKADASGQPLLL